MNLAKFITYTLWFAGTAFAISYIANHKGFMDAASGIPIVIASLFGSVGWIVMFIGLIAQEFED